MASVASGISSHGQMGWRRRDAAESEFSSSSADMAVRAYAGRLHLANEGALMHSPARLEDQA
jgi:hypothetical protein